MILVTRIRHTIRQQLFKISRSSYFLNKPHYSLQPMRTCMRACVCIFVVSSIRHMQVTRSFHMHLLYNMTHRRVGVCACMCACSRSLSCGCCTCECERPHVIVVRGMLERSTARVVCRHLQIRSYHITLRRARLVFNTP